MDVKKTPLYRVHRDLDARMVEFAGWEMPVQYDSALQEHLAVRNSVGVFDVSHMGEIEIQGSDALPMVQKVTCNDAASLGAGQAQYSAFLTPEGTFVDDIVVYRLERSHFLICVNAANRTKDFQWLLSQQEGSVQILDRSDSYAQLALQGPKAEAVLQPLTEAPLAEIRYYWSVRTRVCGTEALVSRTGYTGEDGFEIYLEPAAAPEVWKALLAQGAPFQIRPAGLAARNTLRLEVCYPLYGHEIDDRVNPWEAGLGWIVKLSKGDFIGRESLRRLKEQGPRRRLAGFEMVERGIARDHYRVFLDGEPVGEVTSGSFAPSLQKSIGLTYLPADRCEVGRPVHVEIRGRQAAARVASRPFYSRK